MGGSFQNGVAWRFYGKGLQRASMEKEDGSNAHDDWYLGHAGYRLDWSRGASDFAVLGDAYRAVESQQGAGNQTIIGVNSLARWQRHTERTELQLQVYVDQTQRASAVDSGAVMVRTYDIELQQSVRIGTRHHFVWGAGERVNSYAITNTAGLLFMPPARDLTLGNLFAQDTWSLGDSLKLTWGAKLEDDPYSGWAVQPDIRLAWQPRESILLWAAGSHAIRSPTPFDEDVVEKLGGVVFLMGKEDFRPERVTAYEVGYRGRLSDSFSLSLSAYYNVYDDLRTIEPASRTAFLPLHWDNLMAGYSYGVTGWANWQVNDWWQIAPGITTVHKHLRFTPGSSGLLGLAQAAIDPSMYASVKSSMNLGSRLTVDAMLRYVGALPDTPVKAYGELNGRVGWNLSEVCDLSLSGYNLLHARHREFTAPSAEQIVRSVFLEARWRF
jgi:iron complex outermembrane receptor protein